MDTVTIVGVYSSACCPCERGKDQVVPPVGSAQGSFDASRVTRR